MPHNVRTQQTAYAATRVLQKKKAAHQTLNKVIALAQTISTVQKRPIRPKHKAQVVSSLKIPPPSLTIAP